MKIKRYQYFLFMMLMWKIFFIVSVYADGPLISIEIPSSPNPVGSGARAIGMGGAFIAIADDATAASWNPGGLIQLEKPEVSAVFGYIGRMENNAINEKSVIPLSGEHSIYDSGLNYLSIAYPFELGEKRRNMVISLNYQHQYDFNREWVSDQYTQKGDLYALGLAYCVQITTDFSLGFTLNYWGDSLLKNKWEQKYHLEHIWDDAGQVNSVIDGQENFSFEGWNMNIGFLWKIGENLTLGGIIKTPFTGSIRHIVKQDFRTLYLTRPQNNLHFSVLNEYDEKLHMPLSYGIGLAYRFSDNFTLSADIYKTHWNDFEIENEKGERFSPISGKDSQTADIHPTTWFRLGGEYLFIGEKIVVPIRAGIFYDPAPAEGSVDDYYGFSLGSGINCKWFSFDVAYKFRFGNNVNRSIFDPQLEFGQDVREHTVYISLIYYF